MLTRREDVISYLSTCLSKVPCKQRFIEREKRTQTSSYHVYMYLLLYDNFLKHVRKKYIYV